MTTPQPSTSAPSSPEVLIVGAGPTGLMAAVLLARCGVRVRIFDKNTQQAHESRALGIQARTMELFLNLGLEERMLDAGTIVNGARMFEDGQQRAEIAFDDLGRTDTPFSFFLVVPQRDTETILADELRRLGIEVERQTEVTRIEQTADGVAIHARGADGAEFDARGAYLIGADGAHSVVRKALGLSFEGAAYPQGFLLADCRIDWPLGHDRLMVFLKGKHLAIHFPLPGGENLGRVLAMDIAPSSDPHAPVEQQGASAVSLAEVEAAFRAATGTEVRLSDSVWTTRYRIHHRGVPRYRVGRAFVAGDAAHIHSPAGGQGMNTGLQDAANLAWKLTLALRRPSPGSDALLDTYHAERWPVGQRVLQYTDKLFSAMTSQSDWFTALRNAVLPRVAGTLMHLPAMRAKAFHFVSQLGIRYEENVAVRDAGGGNGNNRTAAFWKNGPAAGHRAPNAPFARNRDVFGLLAGYGFRVLALSRRTLSGEEIGRLHDALAALPPPAGMTLAAHVIAYPAAGRDERILRAESNEVFKAYGVDHETPQAIYLVRPDGYIAWRTDGLDTDGLGEFLRTSLGQHSLE